MHHDPIRTALTLDLWLGYALGMRTARLIVSLVSLAAFVSLGACSSSSSDATTDGTKDVGPTGDGGCLLTTPKEGATCSDGDVLCNPGNLCCEGSWSCNKTTHTWNLLRGGCACGPFDTGTTDSGSDVASDAATDI
jgi:hypothetical protein